MARPYDQLNSYIGSFVWTNSAGVHAFAVRVGAVDYGVAVAGFVNSSSMERDWLLGNYWDDEGAVAAVVVAAIMVNWARHPCRPINCRAGQSRFQLKNCLRKPRQPDASYPPRRP